MADIHVLPGVERRDLVGPATDAARVLQASIDKGITDVIVVGRDRRGELYLAGTAPDADKTVGLLMRAVNMLASATIVNDVVIGGSDGGDVE